MSHPHRGVMMQDDWPMFAWTCPLEENECRTSLENAAGQEFNNVFPHVTPTESQLDTSTHNGTISDHNYLSAPIQPNAGHTPCQPSTLTSGHEQPLDQLNPNYPNPLQAPRHTCSQCGKSYRRKGELTRHVTTAHHRPRSFLCHIDRCPRGIYGKGFARKDKLVDHLVSKKHGLSKVDALYEANLNNA